MIKPKIIKIAKDLRINREKNLEKTRQTYAENCNKLLAIKLLSGGCVYCGWNVHPEILQFHHRDPRVKDIAISKLKQCRTWETIQKEIDKCDLICPNCHMFKHYTRTAFK